MADSAKLWIANNVKWIITIVVIGISNYFILANKIEANTQLINNKVNKIEAQTMIQAEIQKELKNVFSNVDGEVLKEAVRNLRHEVDRLEKLVKEIAGK